MTRWHENPAFWADTAGLIFGPQRWASAATEAEKAVALLGLSPGDTVLDLPCGTGRHSLEFARRGFRVTGVDRTVEFLDEARRRAEAAELDVEWVACDMREFRRPGAFDAAVNLLTSFGYFEDPAEDRKVLENFLASLRPGAGLLMDLMGKEVLARVFQPRDWCELEDGTLFLEDRRIADDWNWVDLRWIAVRGDQRRDYRFGHRLYSADGLTTLLDSVGFTELQVFGDLNKRPYDDQADRLVVLGRKPPA
jgi:SAM-dependent methyltransferase